LPPRALLVADAGFASYELCRKLILDTNPLVGSCDSVKSRGFLPVRPLGRKT